MKRFIPIYILCSLIIAACSNSSGSDADSSTNAADSSALAKNTPSVDDPHPIDLATATYSISTTNYKEDPHIGMPSFDIYLHISGAADSILIANDYTASFFDAASMDNYVKLVPANTVFLINSYYAGGGYYYYGVPEDRMLKIYRIYQEEGNPDNDGVNMAPPTPQLMKTAKVFSDHNEVAVLAIE